MVAFLTALQMERTADWVERMQLASSQQMATLAGALKKAGSGGVVFVGAGHSETEPSIVSVPDGK